MSKEKPWLFSKGHLPHNTGKMKYGVPWNLSDGSRNPEYTARCQRAYGIPPPKPDKYTSIPRIINGKRNPEYQKVITWDSLGIDWKEAKQIYDSSNICAICKKPVSGKEKVLDHNHQTKKIRGILCRNCNSAIGLMEDSLENLQNAIYYLFNEELNRELTHL